MEDEQVQSQSVEIPEVVIEGLRSNAKQKAKLSTHNWRQKGGWVGCTQCDYPHGIRIESNKRMVGIENGVPVFRRV